MLILIGKSGSGKDTILRELVNVGLQRVIPYTTRPLREGEVDGLDYNFITIETFNNMDFIEKRKYDTVYGEWWYGTKEYVENGVCISTVDGLCEMRKNLPLNDITCIYLDVDDSIREERAISRGSFCKDEWDRRLKADSYDFNTNDMAKLGIHIIKNTNIKDTVFQILDIYNNRNFNLIEDLKNEKHMLLLAIEDEFYNNKFEVINNSGLIIRRLIEECEVSITSDMKWSDDRYIPVIVDDSKIATSYSITGAYDSFINWFYPLDFIKSIKNIWQEASITIDFFEYFGNEFIGRVIINLKG